MGVDRTFTVPATGVGQRDYAKSTARAAEATIHGHQEVYSKRVPVSIPANDSETGGY